MPQAHLQIADNSATENTPVNSAIRRRFLGEAVNLQARWENYWMILEVPLRVSQSSFITARPHGGVGSTLQNLRECVVVYGTVGPLDTKHGVPNH